MEFMRRGKSEVRYVLKWEREWNYMYVGSCVIKGIMSCIVVICNLYILLV